MDKEKKGFNYVYTREKFEEYRKLSSEQKLEWLEKMNRFLYSFMTPKDREIRDKYRLGEI